MIKIKEYVLAKSLEEAYTLNQKKQNRIIGGMLWLKMMRLNVNTAIDLSSLGLDKIEETEDAFTIGCMVSLRDFENHEGLNKYLQGANKASVKDIIGVQFKNLATIGGSIYSRFGFSDVLTLLLSLDTYVTLYKGGVVSLEEYVTMKKDRDILVNVIIKKTKDLKVIFDCFRNQKTDFSVINLAFSSTDNKKITAVIGARPHKAQKCVFDFEENVDALAEKIANSFVYGTNMRASDKYRKHLTFVLSKRCVKSLKTEN